MRCRGPAVVAFAVAWLVVVAPSPAFPGPDGEGGDEDRKLALGRALFEHSWSVRDPLSRGGDGLGPVFNARSCLACHNLGGTGGAGSRSKNIDVISARPNRDDDPDAVDEMVGVHPGFRGARSLVLHREGSEPGYETFRLRALALAPDAPLRIRRIVSPRRSRKFALARTQRNSPSLFGAGLIDAVPESLIADRVRRDRSAFPEISGRAARTKEGAVGRFGWKGQTGSLREFVETACAVELGLEVPGHPQGGPVLGAPASTASRGYDLDAGDCEAMVAFVSALPEPVVARSGDYDVVAGRAAGKEIFLAIGCVECHAETLGRGAPRAMYSDLLLHDMGQETGASGSYGMFAPGPLAAETPGAATPPEWRTPPLWGVADTAPYLHDGRAATLDRAIRLHGGEAHLTKARYAALKPKDRDAVAAFLRSLVAPPAATGPIARR